MTKRFFVVFVVVLIQYLLLTGLSATRVLPDYFRFLNNYISDRNWRLNQVSGAYYAGEWVTDSRSDYIYNSTFPTRLDTLKAYAWNNVEFVLVMNTAYTYDASGQYCTQSIRSEDNGTTFEPSSRTSLQYDNQNRVSMIVWESYDSGSSSWVLSQWKKIFYNTNSINNIVDFYNEDPANWDLTTYVNDGQGRPIISTTQNSTDSLSWTNSQHVEINYHPNDTSTGSDFIASISHMYVGFHAISSGLFNTNAMVSLRTDQVYNNGWQNEVRRIYTYDTQNRLIQRADKYWEDGWQDMMQTIFDYDTNGNLHQATESYWEGTSWGLGYRFTCNWGQTTANINNVLPVSGGLSVSVAPNPFYWATDILTKSKTGKPINIIIYNSRGQLIKNLSASDNHTARWDGTDNDNNPVANGLYLIKAVSSDQSDALKILKMK